MVTQLMDCQAWEDIGLPLSTTSNNAAKLYDSAVNQLATMQEDESIGGLGGTFKEMLQADPSFIMGNALALGLQCLSHSDSSRLDEKFEQKFKDLEKMSTIGNEREQMHVKAVLQYSLGHCDKAVSTWTDILADYPNDILALQLAHQESIFQSDAYGILGSVERALPVWKPTSRYYGQVQAMYSFGLEEMNFYDKAEHHAKLALSVNKTNPWATHALAHVYDMTGQTDKGIHMMSSTESDWSGRMLTCHNYWHWALYHIEKDENEQALNVYDEHMSRFVHKPDTMHALTDAASLLQRLEFAGVDVGSRWDVVADLCRPHMDDHLLFFIDVHYLMAFLNCSKAKGGDCEEVSKKFMASIENFLLHGDQETNFWTTCKTVGHQVMKSFVAYKEKRFADAVDVLYPVKNNMKVIAGSHAQRDVLDQLLIMSCIQSPSLKHQNLARALLRERKCRKPDSMLTDRLHAKHMMVHEVYDLQ